ncbi:MAG: hypothetical protein ACRD9R_08760, partial [Pyrinomonadaceae bacterium]
MQRRPPARLALLFITLALSLSFDALAQTRNDIAAAGLNPAPYRDGERLTYSVSFSTFGSAAHVETLVAGRGVFAGREGIELRARVETVGVVSAALF